MPLTSAFADLEIPNLDLWSFLFDHSQHADVDAPLFIDAVNPERFLSFRAIKTATSKFGAALRTQWNWQRGDTIGIFGLNDPDYATAIMGALWAGATVSPMSFTFTAKELAYQLKNSGAKAIVAHPQGLEVVEAAARLAGLPSSRILLFGEGGGHHPSYKHFLQLEGSPESSSRCAVDPAKDTALLVYSSGTTGFPKGVKLSHTNIVANIFQWAKVETLPSSPGHTPSLLAFLPFAHIYATSLLIFIPLFTGPSIYIMPRFDLELCLKSIQRYRITYVALAPPVALLLAKHPLIDKFDLTSLGGLLSAAAPLAPQLIKDLYKRLKITLKQAYGLSETAPGVTIQPWSNAMASKGSVGVLLPNIMAKLVSEDGKEVPQGQPGELWVKGPNIFLGYHNNQEATKNAFSDDGYFKTGDVAYQDTTQNLYIVDRIKELIKYKGYQVAPAELEAMLLENLKVSDVAVIGIYDEKIASEVPRAFIKAAPGLEPTRGLGEEIVEWMNAKVSSPKRLRGGVQFVDEVPRSAAGKILRRVLKDKYGIRVATTGKAKI